MTQDTRDDRLLGDGGNDPECAAAAQGKVARLPPPTQWRKTRGHKSDYVRARLTAMAIETPAFHCEDLYTLFVTTRIINFLKGLDLRHTVDLHTLLQKPWNDWRTQIGFTLLQRLAETRTLYFWTRHGTVANAKFNAQLLAWVLREASHITCQNGAVITVGHWPGW